MATRKKASSEGVTTLAPNPHGNIGGGFFWAMLMHSNTFIFAVSPVKS
jgi:hypothetical protein